MQKIFGLVDCNNFYVSCERLFRPELTGYPVVVLSNNDGCIIARSNEAKVLGIGMGTPFFKVRNLIKKHKVQVFSSNYTLYGDLSHRVMDVLQHLEPEVEIYSIDEAFMMLPPSKAYDLTEYAGQIKEKISRCVGIPVSVGMATTKTLAKIANQAAKKNESYQGVLDLTDNRNLDEILKVTNVKDVWGIGRRYAERLNRHGIYDALQLRGADDNWLRKKITISGLRTVMELRGISCIHLADTTPSNKSIVSSRSFGHSLSSFTDLREAVSFHASTTAQKLRSQGSITKSIQVFLTTNCFRNDQPQYSKSITVSLPQATSDTSLLAKSAVSGLERIYKQGYQYKKVGVILTGLASSSCQQLNLFCTDSSKNTPLMQAIDLINNKWGRNTIQLAAAGTTQTLGMRQSYKSPAYTTDWRALPLVKASSKR